MGNEHWINTSLDVVVLSKKGKKPAKLESAEFKNSLPYIDIEAFETGNIKQFADIDTSNQCQKKDVLVVWDGARFGLTGTDQIGAIGSTLACLTPILIESSYLHKFIQRHYNTIQQKPKGMATPHVDPEVFWNLEFPLPPLPEQKRIVEKLDSILPKAKSIRARLDKIPQILKRFRQSVLASASSGQLTQDWREKQGHIDTDYKISPIRDVITDLRYGTSKKCDKAIRGTAVLRIPNIQKGYIDYDDLKYASFDKSEIKKLKLEESDLLLVRSNGSVNLVGRCAIVSKKDVHCLFAGYLIRLRPDKSKINSAYLNYILKTDDLRLQIELPARSTTGVHNINSEEVENLQIPLPPLEEQHEIVRRVEKLFILADSIEEKYKKALARVEKIEQSVLAKAFRGNLAPQNPDDEPAEELLKRILAEKQKLQKSKPRKVL